MLDACRHGDPQDLDRLDVLLVESSRISVTHLEHTRQRPLRMCEADIDDELRRRKISSRSREKR
jgi:hypothetical protein